MFDLSVDPYRRLQNVSKTLQEGRLIEQPNRGLDACAPVNAPRSQRFKMQR
jgi:hypothetical protein